MSNKNRRVSLDPVEISEPVIFQTPFRRKVDEGEKVDPVSLTVPDMAMSIQEIMVRFASGRPVPLSNNLSYTGDDYYPDTRRMDFVDRDELIEATKERVQRLQEKVEERKKERSEQVRKRKERLNRLLDADEQEVKIDEKPNTIQNDERSKE